MSGPRAGSRAGGSPSRRRPRGVCAEGSVERHRQAGTGKPRRYSSARPNPARRGRASRRGSIGISPSAWGRVPANMAPSARTFAMRIPKATSSQPTAGTAGCRCVPWPAGVPGPRHLAVGLRHGLRLPGFVADWPGEDEPTRHHDLEPHPSRSSTCPLPPRTTVKADAKAGQPFPPGDQGLVILLPDAPANMAAIRAPGTAGRSLIEQ